MTRRLPSSSLLLRAVLVAASLVASVSAQTPSPRSGSEPMRPVATAPTAPPQAVVASPVVAPAQDDTFPTLQRRLTDAVTRGDIPGAVAVAERQHRLFPNEMKATADLGDALLARGDADRAEPLLRAAITQPSKLYTSSIAPVLGGIYANLGQIALAKGQPRDAISALQRAVDYAPTSARPRFLLASAFAAAGDTDRSTREIRAAFDIDSAAARPSDYLLLAGSLRRNDNLAAANESATAGVKRFPSDLELRVERSTILLARDDAAGALCDLLYAEMLLQVDDPRAGDVGSRLRAIRDQSDAASSGGDDPTAFDGLVSYLDDAETGQFDEALPTILSVVDITPKAFVERLLLAHAYVGTGRFGEAEQILTDLLVEDAGSVPVLVELTNLYYAEQRTEAAGAMLRRARSIDGRNARLRQIADAWGVSR